jgi:medium-chain acyl-[acyl-carrier-protein] hydrolase
MRLFCFPHAGGSSAAFHPWGGALPELDVCALEYPGRWMRLREQPITNVGLLVKVIADDLAHLLGDRHAFAGHSYGALVAFELARELRRRGITTTEHLIVASARAPHLLPRLNPIHALPDAQLLSQVGQRYGGLPQSLVDDAEMVQLMVPIIRADMTAFETYTFSAEPPLRSPITAMRGQNDLTVDDQALNGWRQHTAGRFSAHILAGDHFFTNTAAAETFRIVRRELGVAS